MKAAPEKSVWLLLFSIALNRLIVRGMARAIATTIASTFAREAKALDLGGKENPAAAGFSRQRGQGTFSGRPLASFY